MTVEPLSPNEAIAKKVTTLPESVIEAFNEMIAGSLRHNTATFTQNAVVVLICEKMTKIQPDFTRRDIFRNHWLDIEDVYRQEGWRVEYDKPGFNESYDATFTFRKSKA